MSRIVFILLCFFSPACFSQSKDIKQYPDTSDTNEFFELLYGQHGLNNPLTTIKLNILDTALFIVTTKSYLHNYCKSKYNSNDSIAETIELDILRGNKKIPIRDTSYFNKAPFYWYDSNNKLKQKTHFPDNILDKFRKLNLLDFLNKYVKRPSGLNLFIEAYLFEKHILYDISRNEIANASIGVLYRKYGISYDPKLEIWEKIKK
jgi:hypothetical protein